MDWAGSAAWFARGGLACLLIAACVADSVERRIPNWVSAVGLGTALIWHGLAPASGGGVFGATDPGGLGLWASATGGVAAFCAFFALHLLRVVGAGDVKLMGMLGAWFGLHAVPMLILYVLLAGGLLALARIAAGVSPRAVVANLGRLLATLRDAAAGGGRGDSLTRLESADRMPYAWALALGAAALAFRQYVG